MKELIAKHRNMKSSELSKLINRRKASNIHSYNITRIEETLKRRGSSKTTKKGRPCSDAK